MAITVPNSASTYTACGLISSACNHWINLGFTATPGGSGSAAYYSGSALTDGSPLLLIVCASGAQTFFSPLFNSPVGIMVASVSGGSAIIWLKAGS
jgi:hypothetical protein